MSDIDGVMESNEVEIDDALEDNKSSVRSILIESRRKCRRIRLHGKQKYRTAWEQEPDFKSWLHRDPDSEYKAICAACNASFVAEKTVIRNHANGRKHKRMAALYNTSKLNFIITKGGSANATNSLAGSGFHSHETGHIDISSNDSKYISHSVIDNEPVHKTIFISTSSSGLPTVKKSDTTILKHVPNKPSVSKAEEAELKLRKFMKEVGVTRHNAQKFNNIFKQCFSDSEISRNLNWPLSEKKMTRRVPLTCRDPFFRDLDRDFFSDASSSRHNWADSTPPKLFDQHFATGLWSDEVPSGTSSIYMRSRRPPREKSGFSFISESKDKFAILLEVPHFLPDELKVRVTGNLLEIEGKHAERQDDHGSVSRHFVRKYNLPEDVMVDLIGSSLSAEGVLSIEAPRKPPEPARPAEREVPIQKMGPSK